jgi:hypothetical protein
MKKMSAKAGKSMKKPAAKDKPADKMSFMEKMKAAKDAKSKGKKY